MEKFEPEQKPEMATDIEVANFLAGHIEAPCEDLQGNNIRDFYIREARKVLPTMTNEFAKEILEKTIRKYTPN